MGAERDRVDAFGKLEDGLLAGQRLVPVGSVPERAPVGHGARGLQRRRRGVGLLPPRPRPVAGLPVGRGRPGRLQRHRAAAVPVAGALERPGPDPQGADLRAHRQRGQPRRGRQGVLVVRRRAAEPLAQPVALPLPAGARSRTTTWSPRTADGASTSPSTSCSTPASSTRTGTGSSRSTTPRTTRTDLLDDRAGHQRRARTPTRCTSCRRSGSATPGRGATTSPTPQLRAGDASRSRSTTRCSATSSSSPAPGPTASRRRCCSATTRRTPPGCTARTRARRTPRTASTTTSCTARPTVNPAGEGTKASGWYRVEVAPAADRRAAPAAARPRGPRRRRRRRRFDQRHRPASRRPTSSTPS